MIDILKATDRCVMCGMCLPHCPTYGKNRNEADSPRGRIALIQALSSGGLPTSDALVSHLDGCLGCRACEVVCPAGVPYGEIIDAARTKLRRERTRHIDLAQLLTDVIIKRRWSRRVLYWLLLAYQRFGIQKIMRTSGVLKFAGLERVESLLPELERATEPQARKQVGNVQPKVALFTGCVAEILDRTTLAASQSLLTRLGYDVHVPSRQTCCGALHQHDGIPGKALGLMKRNVDAFDESGVDAVISTATGCGAQLAEYPKYLDGDAPRHFAQRHKDICQFLAEHGWSQDFQFKPLAAKVALHTPCSLNYVLNQAQHTLKLLARIPDIELFELHDNARCCGAAGGYMLRQPQMADELLTDKIEDLKRAQPAMLVTSNIGCALHITAGLRRAGLKIRVVHPVVLLNEQLMDG
jgi:glycolate oxidase iron-sulfur subunit